jgi:ubiquinone/menaquinone biosynthesis C-methylase UbiE
LEYLPLATKVRGERRITRSQRADYGIDAPNLVIRFALIGTIGILLGVGLLLLQRVGYNPRLQILIPPSISMGCTFLVTAGVMVWGSKRRKLALRDKILSSIQWRGDEQVLDVGCGRGLMLIGAAKHLTTGKVFGVDPWQTEDQSGNSRETTLHNCRTEQVEDRVILKDGDARKLEFAENTFDIVLSSWAIHNIYDEPGRGLAVREIVRVLKPLGRLIIVDIKHTSQYARVLRECRIHDVRRKGPDFLFVIPTFTLTAVKPPT